MNIIFITMYEISSLDERNLYTDLMREFVKNSNTVNIVCPCPKNSNNKTEYIDYGNNCGILHVKTGTLQKVNIIKKGIATLRLESQFIKAIKQYLCNTKFDLIIYSTPPVTFAEVISYLKKRDGAASYLLLKDIFPQNAVDIGMMSKSGFKSVIYKVFRKKEKKLYNLSDYIGCMSQANMDYIINHNHDVSPEKIHVNPNSIEVIDQKPDSVKKAEIYEKYSIPKTATTFIYGGNLGKPQDIPFIIECLKANADKSDRFFVICGTGTEYSKLKEYIDEYAPKNVLLINGLPKSEYDDFVKAFDVGLIFLDHRFTIPNFPSRLLSYMQSGMPVLACTDANTDIGKVITENHFGWWCESNSTVAFTSTVEEAMKCDLNEMGQKGYDYLLGNYTSKHSYDIITEHLN